MAGDDATSVEFVAAYDAAAGEAVAALADLVQACTRVGHLTPATWTNHAVANIRAVIAGSAVYDGGWLPDVGDDAGYVTVLPCTPPTARGATTPGLSTKVDWILDHIEGFVWPGADLARLREAGAGWRSAAGALAELAGCCDSATRGFWLERSPEIPSPSRPRTQPQDPGGPPWPPRMTALGRVRVLRRGRGGQARRDPRPRPLAARADRRGRPHLRRARRPHRRRGTAVGLGAVAAKVAAQSPRFAALLETLRALAAGVAAPSAPPTTPSAPPGSGWPSSRTPPSPAPPPKASAAR